MAKVVVAGAGGYIGGAIVRQLVLDGHDVRCIVRRKRNYLPADQVLVDLVNDPLGAAAALEGFDVLVNAAGSNDQDASAEAERDALALTQTLIEAAKGSQLRRALYISTMKVYGPVTGLVTEDHPLDADSGYGRARAASERLLERELPDHIENLSFRLTNAVGPPIDPTIDRWQVVASDLCRSAVERGVLELATPGLQWRDFIGLKESARIMALGVDHIEPGTYNVGSGKSLRVLDIAHMVHERAKHFGLHVSLEIPESNEPAPLPMTVSVAKLESTGVKIDRDIVSGIDDTFRMLRPELGA